MQSPLQKGVLAPVVFDICIFEGVVERHILVGISQIKHGGSCHVFKTVNFRSYNQTRSFEIVRTQREKDLNVEKEGNNGFYDMACVCRQYNARCDWVIVTEL